MADVVALPRGGLWVMTPAGSVQFGAPAETIKDTLQRAGGVPRIFVLGKTLFDNRRGLSLADLEFPIYYQLFVKQRPLVVIGAPDVEERVRRTVQESLLGPRELDLSADVPAKLEVPDLRREYEHFRKGTQYKTGVLELDDALDFRALRGTMDLGDGVTLVDEGTGFSLEWDHAVQARFPAAVPLPPEREETHGVSKPFTPPLFGVTTLGRSHGFDPDPEERTSGFILWIGGRGVMVDPPVRSTELLRQCEINPKLIDAVLLTHCHADHDAGTMQKALAEGRITLYTIPTIFASYKRKWTQLTGIPDVEFDKLFDLRKVRVHEPVEINGARFLFRFTLHSIPTIAFEVHFRGRSFNYSSDTLNDPRQVEAIFKAGGLDPERRDELLHFDWGHDLIFHESGVPPLHTPLDVLEAQTEDVRRRMYVLHTTPSRLGANTGLRLAQAGPQGTISLDVEQPPEDRVLRHLTLLGSVRLFSDLPLARAAQLLAASREFCVPAGTRFITAGEKGDALYVVTGGKARVVRDGRELKVYGLGDYMGETAVFLRKPRNADVYAITDVELLAIDGAEVRAICAGTRVIELCRRHARVRDLDAWSLFEETELFSGMTTTQKTALETVLRPAVFKPGQALISAGTKANDLVIVADGQVRLTGEAQGSVRRGGIVGDPGAVMSKGRHGQGGVAVTAGRGFKLSRVELLDFLDENPGLKVRLQPWTASSFTSIEAGSLISLLDDYL